MGASRGPVVITEPVIEPRVSITLWLLVSGNYYSTMKSGKLLYNMPDKLDLMQHHPFPLI